MVREKYRPGLQPRGETLQRPGAQRKLCVWAEEGLFLYEEEEVKKKLIK